MFRRRLRLCASVGAGLVIAASAAAQPVPAAVASPSAEENPVVSVTIDSFLPAAPKPGDQVVLTGRITNTSSTTFGKAQAGVCIGRDRLTTRAQLATIPTEANEPIQQRNDCVGLANSNSPSFQEFGTLAPKASVRFRLVVPWRDWGIGPEPGVYTVGVRFRGDTSPSDRLSAGLSRTLMPVVSAQPMPRKVNTALVIPLRHRPTLLTGDRFANESLADSLAPTGELGRLLALGRSRKVTWLVDPAMIDEVKRMAAGYRVHVDQQIRPGKGQKTAAGWLSAFTASRAKNPVVLLPYGDPDVGSLIDAGGGLRELVSQSRTATEQFNLGGPQLFQSGLWLDNGSASSRNLAAGSTGYAGAKADDVNLVPSSSWSADTRPTLSPSPVYNVLTPEGPVKSVRTVIADSALTAGGPDPATANSPIQVRQRFAAETALLAATGKGAITVVAVPPRGWSEDGLATTALAEGLSLPWTAPVGLDTLYRSNPANPLPKPALTKGPNVPRSTPGLAPNQLQQIKSLSDALRTYVSLLNNPDQADENLRRALLRSASTGWRAFPDDAQEFASYELSLINGQLGKVHLVTNSSGGKGGHREIKVNLSGSKGTFPLTIANELNVSVRVGVVVTSANRSDLRIEPLQTRVLPPGQKATYQINASAEQNGLIRADAQVVSSQDLPVGSSQELLIQAAQYGSVGWILVGSAVALLFGTSAVRIYRRVRSERRNPTPETGEDPLHPAPIDPAVLNAGPADDGPHPDEPNPLTAGEPLRVTPDSLKEGVGTKDG
ncbi:DUF6049 family protein [Kribbella flavida]|uniref:DUF6049 family protein n=1 Tax=Kribbella flavida TaxID=182640 RepID=UPI0011D24A8C|nr:DUF6049 family protein [Kribbella flavida]